MNALFVKNERVTMLFIQAYYSHCPSLIVHGFPLAWTSLKVYPCPGVTTILVVVDRLTKYGHFIVLAHPFIANSVAQIYLDQVYKLYGAPKSIV